MPPHRPRLGYFSRLLDDASAGERYRIVARQIEAAEALGFHSAWVAQHHFSAEEGGLPSPLVFLAHVAARTTRIRLGTGVLVLPLEDPIRTAEDAAVLAALCGDRLELGVGTGGNAATFERFGLDAGARRELFADKLEALRRALVGEDDDAVPLYPEAPQLARRLWQATFSPAGGRRAGAAGDGLMLSRTQPRPSDRADAPLADLQRPIVDAYRAALPSAVPERILVSRTLFVADDAGEAKRWTEVGLRRSEKRLRAFGVQPTDGSLAALIRASDTIVGTPEDVVAQLAADPILRDATDLAVQVHSVDPPAELVLRSLELTATVVAPALGLDLAPPDPSARPKSPT